MRQKDQSWMDYIDAEVRAVCEAMGWAHQVRRKWSVREIAVTESPISDYEWKLMPRAEVASSAADDFEGVYYVLQFDKSNGRFILQHDTAHCGIWGPQWEASTYTEIRPTGRTWSGTLGEREATEGCPPPGWLRDHLVDLVRRFGPNTFSVT